MCSKEILLLACIGLLLGGSCPSTTTTLVAAMSISNADLERFFRTPNISQQFTMSEERIAMDMYTYAFLNYSYGETDVKFDEEKARYGEGKIASVQGKLVHISNVDDVSDDYACTPNILGTRGSPTPAAGTLWIALVRRGRCTFEEKVKNVHEKGAYGVIIYNDKPVMNLEKMQIKGKTRNITAVITYQDIGLDMAYRLDQGDDVFCIIKEGRSGMRAINTLNRTSVLFVSISFIVLMVISLVWLVFYYIQRFRYLQTKDQQSRQLCSVTKKAIMKIPTKTGKSSDDKDMDSDCCAICIEAYKASDCIRVLPCKHEFHKNCIDPWLIEHRTCPMCKLDVLKFYGYVVGDQIHTTPSPQHIPPNIAPVNDNDVPVIVVAIPHAAPTQQQQQPQQSQQQQQLLSEPGHSIQTSLLSSVSLSSSTSSSSSDAAFLAEEQQPNNNSNSSKKARNHHNRNHSCSYNSSNICHNHHYQYHQHRQEQQHCCCAGSPVHNSQISCNGPLLASSNNNATTTVGGAELNRRNSAPHVLQVSTASRQFIGSEESIFEFEAERTDAQQFNNAGATNSTQTNQIVGPSRIGGALIRSREFVIDFPRIFVLEAGSNVGDARNALLPARLPERSQSSLSLANTKDWMSLINNKLEDQQGQRCRPKPSRAFEMQENLLGIRLDSIRKRRSRSADGRYSNGFFARKELAKQQKQQNEVQAGKHELTNLETKEASINGQLAVLRRNSNALYELTEASYAQSRQRNVANLELRSETRRSSILSCIKTEEAASVAPAADIKIQINGEGVKLDD